MPNGGSDCCGCCRHNRAVQEMGTFPDESLRDLFWERSHCTVRDVNITNPFWTYCRNFDRGKIPEERDKRVRPKGWIWASALYEGRGYDRIPWDDKNEPRVSVPATCSVCGDQTDKGIEIDHEGRTVGFCTNRHYVQWWKTIHHDDNIRVESWEPEQQ